MKSDYTWIPFYKELAKELLRYKHNRRPLVDWIYAELSKVGDKKSLVEYLHQKDGSHISDIDPFSVFAIFNRSITFDNKTTFLKKFKDFLHLKNNVPSDFDGIPTVDSRRAFFFTWESNNNKVIYDLWQLFEKAVTDNNVDKEFNQVIANGMPRNSLTMVLYWVNPDRYIGLDKRNRSFLEQYGFKESYPNLDYAEYSGLLKRIQDKMTDGSIPYNTFSEISFAAWSKSKAESPKEESEDTENDSTNYWLGGYTLDGINRKEEFLIDNKWMGVGTADINKKIESIRPGDVIMLKSSYTKGVGHKISVLKISAIGRVTSAAVKGEKFYTIGVEWLPIEEKEFTDVKGGYWSTLHKLTDELFINYAKSLLDTKTMNKYQEYIDLLEANKNLILTGAPGTGKTFLAKEIAKAMEAECGFVQFHPSYDYTDFVEGLRPINDNCIGFKLCDGVFKEFCKKAITTKISHEYKFKIHRVDEYIDILKQCAIKNYPSYYQSNIYPLLKKHQANFEIIDNQLSYRYPTQSKTYSKIKFTHLHIDKQVLIRFLMDCPTPNDLTKYKEIAEIVKRISSVVDREEYSMVAKNRKPFVFIIDEINRGEISKIFGELFFSIDPGYRGEVGKVNTQYQNMIKDDDVFKHGFYVPENVYIIGTMNDIDRSVESMDFAMRRRFAWKEVSVEDSMSMLENEPQELKNRMKRLNEAILKINGLGKAYQIGAAYFLKCKDYGYDYEKLWKYHLEGLLAEYLRGNSNADKQLEGLKQAYDNATPKNESVDTDNGQ